MITSIQIGSLNLNGDSHYALEQADGLGLPPVRNSSFNLAGEHFGRFVSAFYGSRRFALGGTVIGDTVSDFITRRMSVFEAFDAFKGEQTITFTLSDGRVLTLQAVLIQLDFPPRVGWPVAAKFHAELEAAFPFFVAASQTTLSLSLLMGGGGTVPPVTMPMSLSMGSGGSIITVNQGTAPAYPTIRIEGPVTNPAVRNVTTGEEMRFSTVLGAGEYLDIDIRNKTITDQAGANRYALMSGEWWKVQPGMNELAFRADSYNASALATFTYANTYLAI